MSCLMTVIDKWSGEIGHPKAFFLMPLSYLLLISGTFAIFSTSTNLIAQGLLVTHGMPPFDNFDLALPALACTVVTVVYLIVVTPVVLRRFEVSEESSPSRRKKTQSRMQNRYDVRIQITGKNFKGATLRSSGLLAKLSGEMRDVLFCERYGETIEGLSEDTVLEFDDVLWLHTSVAGVAALFQTTGVSMLALDLSDEWAALDKSSRELVEAVVDKESPLISHRLGSAKNIGQSTIAPSWPTGPFTMFWMILRQRRPSKPIAPPLRRHGSSGATTSS
eukprot:SRR837773.3198.p1 GENE.SRR837773.3198~~SRR837773.3198.p1  ORF type:complete len:277 (+),score=57.72 SRR837773.3198:31-861(+)